MARLLPMLAWLVVAVGHAAAQGPALVLPRTNPPATVTQRIGVTDVEVRYNRPSVKGRVIFGGLVPFDQVWRTGSDEATTLRVSDEVTVNGTSLAAGTYELFTIPGRDRWTIILQRQRSQWGSYAYDPAHDLLRVAATPATLAAPVESFTIAIDDVTASTATLHLRWDRTQVAVTLGVDVVALTVPRIDAALKADGRKPYFTAAMFYFENDLDVHKAAAWMALALEESPGHIGMLYRQALILEKAGNRAAAMQAARASLAGAAQSARELREEYTRLNTALLRRLENRQ